MLNTEMKTFEKLELIEDGVRAQMLLPLILADIQKNGGPEFDKEATWQGFAQALTDTYFSLYDLMHQGRSEYPKTKEVDGRTKKFQTRYLSPEEKAEFAPLFRKFAAAFFMPDNTLRKKIEDPAQPLQTLFEDLRKTALYDKDMTFGLLAIIVGQSEKLRPFYPCGINYIRPEPGASKEQCFRDAISDHPLPTPKITYTKFINPPGKEYTQEDPTESTYVKIGGLRFASCQIAHPDFWPHGQTHLILKTGQLINLTQDVRGKIDRHLYERKPLSELVFTTEENHSLAEYIDLENQPPQAKEICQKIFDAVVSLHSNKPAGPVCLDEDKLTGLRMDKIDEKTGSPVAALKEFLKKAGYKDGFVGLLRGADRHPEGVRQHITEKLTELNNKAQRETAVDTYPAQLMARAMHRLPVMLEHAWNASEEALKGKKGDLSNPRGYMPIGVSGSGKSGIMKIAAQEIGDSGIVTASLDDGRSAAKGKEGLEYWLLLATENHGHDYKDFTEFGELVRALTFERALEGKYNIFWDASGIPWEGKNAEVAKRMHDAGYDVSAYKTSTPFFTRENSDSVTYRLGGRASKERRFVTPEIASLKLKLELKSFFEAKKDPNVNTFEIDTANAQRTPYLMEIPRVLSLEEIRELETMVGNNGVMRNYLIKQGRLEETFPWPAEKDADFKVTAVIDEGKTYAVSIIPNMDHYIRERFKSLYNFGHPITPHKSPDGPEIFLIHRLPFDVLGVFKTPEGLLDIPLGEAQKVEWPVYQFLLKTEPVREPIPFPEMDRLLLVHNAHMLKEQQVARTY